MKRFMLIMMIVVLGTFVVKGFTSVCPTIKTDGIEVNSDYSCDQVDLLSGTVLVTDLNSGIDVGNYVIASEYAINNTTKKESKFKPLEIEYIPPLINNDTGNIFTNDLNYRKVIAGGSGGMPYTKNIILATDKNIRV